MTKFKATDEKRRIGKASGLAKAAPVDNALTRNIPSGQFVLGRKAFAHISAVEGFYLSADMPA